jgi:peptidoglycan-associated lipoprotein
MNFFARCSLPVGLVAALCFAGCASQPLPDDPRSPTVVTRTADSTVWSTPEAIAAAAAAAEAAERARVAGRSAGARGRTAGPAASTPASTAKPDAVAAPAAATAAPTRTFSEAITAPDLRRLAFDFDSFDIKPEFNPVLEGHARWLQANPAARWVVEGHADDRGGAEYNLALGQKRAQAVVKALLLLGVPEAQLEAVSFGDTRPLAEGHDEAAWAQNRRAELKER